MKLFLVCSLALLAVCAAAQPQTKEAKIEELLKLTGGEKMSEQALDQAKAMMMSGLPATMPAEAREKALAMQTRILEFAKQRMSSDRLHTGYVKIFSETYTDAEIDGLLAFYRSPAGKAYVEKMPIVMQKTMMLVQDLMKDMLPEIVRLAKEGEQKPQ